jgi:hypothetical protein
MRQDKEKLMELCAHAADEQDPQKLAVLILEINFILEAKERGLLKAVQSSSPGQNNSTLRSPLQSKP